MPYIKQSDRERINPPARDDLEHLSRTINTPGDLNFVFSVLIKKYLEQRGISYTNMNEVIGVLECCKLEVYRRLTAPYEDEKIEENGDVY